MTPDNIMIVVSVIEGSLIAIGLAAHGLKKMKQNDELKGLGPKPRKFTLKSGWLKMSGHEVEIVKTIKKVPDLRYHYIAGDDYNGVEELVYVTDEVGTAIELYVRGDGYADMSLDEFLLKTLFGKLTGQMNENAVGSRNKNSNKST